MKRDPWIGQIEEAVTLNVVATTEEGEVLARAMREGRAAMEAVTPPSPLTTVMGVQRWDQLKILIWYDRPESEERQIIESGT